MTQEAAVGTFLADVRLFVDSGGLLATRCSSSGETVWLGSVTQIGQLREI
jgi:hypothetical protein